MCLFQFLRTKFQTFLKLNCNDNAIQFDTLYKENRVGYLEIKLYECKTLLKCHLYNFYYFKKKLDQLIDWIHINLREEVNNRKRI